ncbi:MAG TPA: cytochrome c biogenesis protein ResB, partial [Dehalococcoidia bacterium]|nr:cytochrome c biogenesis protein ResB [Dehalococcoidia bacterium]
MARVATTAGWTQSLRGFDPFKTLFRLLTSVRVALLLLGAVAVAALLGVIFPQAPDEVRAVPSAYDAYTEFQRTRYGVFTDAMRRLGLFEVFHSYWFNGLILVLLIA